MPRGVLPHMPAVASRTRTTVVLQKRDLQILDVFRAVRFADTETLATILAPDPFPNAQRLRLRLPKLERCGLLDRPARRVEPNEIQIEDDGRGRGRPQDIWALAQKGADLLELNGDWNRNNRRLRPGAFPHPLAIARIFALLCAEARSGRIQLVSWQGENTFRDRVNADGRILPIVPDATFEIGAAGERSFKAFLEIDNSSEPLTRTDWNQSSAFKKFVGYWTYWRRVLKPRGDGNVVVLTIAKTARAAERLRATAAKADDRQVGSNLFWFTSEEEVASCSQALLYRPIWITAAGQRRTIVPNHTLSTQPALPAVVD